MNSVTLLKLLLEKLEAYENKCDDKNALTVDGFVQHFTDAHNLDQLTSDWVETGSQQKNPHSIENNIERVIAQHLLLLYRYIKFYSKTALAESQINSMEEFGFLITVLQYESISKTELIRRNIIEKSSGIEIINRLLKSQLFTQKDNPEDHRSMLIQLTDVGKMELFKIFEKMNILGKIATGNLSNTEKQHLATMLKKLDTFHFSNYNNKELKTLEDYLPNEE